MARPRTKPEDKMKPVRLLVTPWQDAALARLAEIDGMPTNERIRRLIDAHIEQHALLRGWTPILHDTEMAPDAVQGLALPEADSV